MHMLTDDAFVRLVADDVKNRVTDEQRSYLRLSSNSERWVEALQSLLTSLDNQTLDLNRREQAEVQRYSSLGDDGVVLLAELQTDIEERRTKIGRFRFHVETRLDEARRMQSIASYVADERGRASDFFREAIARHREMILAYDFEYSDIDEALWATLDGLWKFDDVELGG